MPSKTKVKGKRGCTPFLFNQKGGITLLEKLIEDDKIQKSIKEYIEKEDNIEKIGACLRYIADASKKQA